MECLRSVWGSWWSSDCLNPPSKRTKQQRQQGGDRRPCHSWCTTWNSSVFSAHIVSLHSLLLGRSCTLFAPSYLTPLSGRMRTSWGRPWHLFTTALKCWCEQVGSGGSGSIRGEIQEGKQTKITWKADCWFFLKDYCTILGKNLLLFFKLIVYSNFLQQSIIHSCLHSFNDNHLKSSKYYQTRYTQEV